MKDKHLQTPPVRNPAHKTPPPAFVLPLFWFSSQELQSPQSQGWLATQCTSRDTGYPTLFSLCPSICHPEFFVSLGPLPPGQLSFLPQVLPTHLFCRETPIRVCRALKGGYLE